MDRSNHSPGRRRGRMSRRAPLLVLLRVSQSSPSSQRQRRRPAGGELTVMTRNLSFGTDLTPIVAATTRIRVRHRRRRGLHPGAGDRLPGAGEGLGGRDRTCPTRPRRPPGGRPLADPVAGRLLADAERDDRRGRPRRAVARRAPLARPEVRRRDRPDRLRHRGAGPVPGRARGRPTDPARGHPRPEVGGPEADERPGWPVRRVRDGADDHRGASRPAVGLGLGRRDAQRPRRSASPRPTSTRSPASPSNAGGRVPDRARKHDAADRLGWRLQLRRRSNGDHGRAVGHRDVRVDHRLGLLGHVVGDATRPIPASPAARRPTS